MLMPPPPCYKLRKHVNTKPEIKINNKFLVLCIYFYYVIFNLEKNILYSIYNITDI